MSVLGKLFVSGAMLIGSVAPSLAFWECNVPEIDGPAGVSAVALIVTASMIAYNRMMKQ